MAHPEEALAVAEGMAALAEGQAQERKTPRCIEGEAVFYLEGDKALVPGHIYSEAGVREMRQSGICEYHFDTWAEEWAEELRATYARDRQMHRTSSRRDVRLCLLVVELLRG